MLFFRSWAAQLLPSLLKRQHPESARVDSGKGRKKTKIQSWDRNIMCLPSSLNEEGEMVVPRAATRADLASRGLSGKIHLESWMTEQEVMAEIRSVFCDPMRNDPDFSFSILQSAGAGSRRLTIPSVSTFFQWNAKQVVQGAGQGYIYILAHDALATSDPEASKQARSTCDSEASEQRQPTLKKVHVAWVVYILSCSPCTSGGGGGGGTQITCATVAIQIKGQDTL